MLKKTLSLAILTTLLLMLSCNPGNNSDDFPQSTLPAMQLSGDSSYDYHFTTAPVTPLIPEYQDPLAIDVKFTDTKTIATLEDLVKGDITSNNFEIHYISVAFEDGNYKFANGISSTDVNPSFDVGKVIDSINFFKYGIMVTPTDINSVKDDVATLRLYKVTVADGTFSFEEVTRAAEINIYGRVGKELSIVVYDTQVTNGQKAEGESNIYVDIKGDGSQELTLTANKISVAGNRLGAINIPYLSHTVQFLSADGNATDVTSQFSYTVTPPELGSPFYTVKFRTNGVAPGVYRFKMQINHISPLIESEDVYIHSITVK